MSRYLDIIRKKAEKGDPKFQHELAFEYFSGKKLKKDDSLAVDWWLKSAKKKYGKAYYNLAYMYFTGSGVSKNLEKAIKYHVLSSKKKHSYQAVSFFWLGYNIYFNHISGKPDVNKGLRFLAKAASMNLVNAQVLLSSYYDKGEIFYNDIYNSASKLNYIKIRPNKVKCIKYLKMAVKNKFIPSTAELINKYLKGDGVKKNIKKAYFYLSTIPNLNNSKMLSEMTLPENEKIILKRKIKAQKRKIMSLIKKINKNNVVR